MRESEGRRGVGVYTYRVLSLLPHIPQAILPGLTHWSPWLATGSEAVRKMASVYLALLSQQTSSPVSSVIRELFALYQLNIASVNTASL